MSPSSNNPYSWLRSHIVISLCLAAFISIILVGGAIYYQYRSVVSEKATARLVTLVMDHQASIETFLQEVTSAMRVVALLEPLEVLSDPPRLKRIFRLLEEGYDYAFEDLGVIGPDGYHLAYAGPFDLMDKNYANELWFKEVMEKRTYISDVFLGYREVPHFIIALKVGDGPSAWILRATVNARKFGELVEFVRFGRTGHAYIVSADGHYQTHSRHGHKLLEKALPEHIDIEPFEGVRFSESQEDGRKVYRAKTWMKDDRWLLVVEQDVDDVFWEFYTVREASMFMFAVGMLLLAGLTYYSTHSLVEKVTQVEIERTQIDEQLIHSQKLASIGQLSAGIAHEINNPLAVIGEEAGWIQDILKREHLKDLKDMDEIQDSLREIGVQAGRCREITHKLLSFARKRDSAIKDIDINKLVDDVLSMREKDATLSNITLKRKFHENLPPVHSDASQLRQVFLNLINNALDAVKKDGTLTVTTELRGDRAVRVLFTDTGMGIPEENIHKVFDPFFTTKPPGKGTGLGLSICHGIIEKLGGKIFVESEVGKGTTFIVRLPLEPKRGGSSASTA